jgi:hypothetical protein
MRYQDTVVVGVEGPEPDRFVLDWAAQQATARGVQLWVCHCWEWSSIDRAPLPLPADVAAEARSAPEGLLDAAVDAVHATFPDLPWPAHSATAGPPPHC